MRTVVVLFAVSACALSGCLVAAAGGAVIGTAVGVTGAVVGTGLKATGAVVHAATGGDKDKKAKDKKHKAKKDRT